METKGLDKTKENKRNQANPGKPKTNREDKGNT